MLKNNIEKIEYENDAQNTIVLKTRYMAILQKNIKNCVEWNEHEKVAQKIPKNCVEWSEMLQISTKQLC